MSELRYLCKKVEHTADGGYLHAADDDRSYWVDNLMYCGRCHEWMGHVTTWLNPADAGKHYEWAEPEGAAGGDA